MTDYIADYRTWLQEEKHASDNTLSSYLRDINQFKTWLLGAGSPDLRRVKKDTINEYMLYLSGAGKSPATITRCTASLKSFYAYMLGRGAVKTNPAKNVAALKVERKCPEILTSKEVESCFSSSRSALTRRATATTRCSSCSTPRVSASPS